MPDRPLCGGDACPDCLGRTHALLREPRGDVLLPGARPTAAGLERHALRFGPGMVAETAAQYGIAVAVERPKKTTPRGPSLRARVAAHVEAGLGAELIAEMENLTPGRARRLIDETTEETP